MRAGARGEKTNANRGRLACTRPAGVSFQHKLSRRRKGRPMSLYRSILRSAAICLAGAAMIGVAEAAGTAKIAGIAFVDSNTTGQGSRATLPAGAKIYPPGT